MFVRLLLYCGPTSCGSGKSIGPASSPELATVLTHKLGSEKQRSSKGTRSSLTSTALRLFLSRRAVANKRGNHQCPSKPRIHCQQFYSSLDNPREVSKASCVDSMQLHITEEEDSSAQKGVYWLNLPVALAIPCLQQCCCNSRPFPCLHTRC